MEMGNREFSVVVWGATGFTGKLTLALLRVRSALVTMVKYRAHRTFGAPVVAAAGLS